jgi:hypothetical protein
MTRPEQVRKSGSSHFSRIESITCTVFGAIFLVKVLIAGHWYNHFRPPLRQNSSDKAVIRLRQTTIHWYFPLH